MGGLRSLGARLSGAERFVFAGSVVLLGLVIVLGAGALVVVAPLVAVAVGAPLAAFGAAAILLIVRRLRRRALDRSDPQHAGSLGVSVGTHGDTAGLALESASPERRRLVESFAARTSTAVLLRSGQATRAAVHREALALRVTDGRFELAALLSVGVARPDLVHRDGITALIALVRVLGSLPTPPPGFDELLVRAAEMATEVPEGDRVALVGLLISRGRSEAARSLLATVRRETWAARAAAVDLLNPRPGGDGDAASWLAAFNAPFAAAGLEQLEIVDGEGRESFLRVSAPAAVASSINGPRISVVMTTYRPGPELGSAVASIIAQTWADWELLLVDDGSGPDYDVVLHEVATMDSRIRLVRTQDNAGAYARRNDGLDLSSGTYVTFHDSDDWSHPRRLELQARALEQRRQLPGVVVSALRTTGELGLWQRRGAALRLCEPSLMVRRDVALARAGYFDAVRIGADVEYRERLGAAVGVDVAHLRTAAPLVLMRADDRSLSGSDFSEGWTHPARIAYRSLHRCWRGEVARREGDLRIERRPAARPFPAPERMIGTPSRRRYDVLLLADLFGHARGRRRRAILEAISRIRGAGRSLAVRPIPRPFAASPEQDLDPRLLSALFDAGAELLILGEAADVDEVVVLDPALLLALPDDDADDAQTRRVTVSGATGPARVVYEDIVRRRWDRDIRWLDG